MLKSTLELVEYLKIDKDKRETSIVLSHIKTILKLGSKTDATILLDSFLFNPSDFDHTLLWPLFQKFGDTNFAQKIFDRVIVDQELCEEVHPEVLNVLAILRYEPIKTILYKYAFSNGDSSDYHLQTASLRGLLNFDCSEYIDVIRQNIYACYNKQLFPEFVPALVCKLPEKNLELQKLYELGDKFASTDCNSGIILGFSHCEEEGKKYFKKVIFKPNWETYSSGTGTLDMTYFSMKNLKISFSELYGDIKEIQNTNELEYAIRILFCLFDLRISDYEDDNMEDFRTLYHTFYSWENPNESNNLIDLSRQVKKESEAYHYQKLFEFKLTEQIILENF